MVTMTLLYCTVIVDHMDGHSDHHLITVTTRLLCADQNQTVLGFVVTESYSDVHRNPESIGSFTKQ